MKHIYTPLFAVYLFLGCTAVVAEDVAQPRIEALTGTNEESSGWPREFHDRAGEVVVYQPQMDEWTDHTTLTARAAVSVQFAGSDEFHYGALYLKAATEVDKEQQQVLLHDFTSTKLHFPNIDDEIAAKAGELVTKVLPSTGSVIMPLERLVADLQAGSQGVREVDLNLDPPPIFYSDQPAILLAFMGEPSFKPVEGVDDLMFAINTNWDLLLDLSTSTYYLLNGESWMETADPVKGPWKNAQRVPGSFSKLPDDDDWSNVKQHIPGKVTDELTLVAVATEPSELILTDGEPEYGVVSGTRLLYVSNTDSDLFYDSEDENFYFLTAGRWFRAEALEGPWSAASADLPEEFAKIPEDHKLADVLSAVPGTPDAEAAVLLASVPQKATVKRKDTTTEIFYEGEPEFVEIPGTSPRVYYGINSPNDVFRVSGLYYALVDGVWFVASGPRGVWAVAVEVDEAIYSIPETSPKYNATYVRVYDSTPDHVVVGYTSGYSGSYVAATGVLMFGLGLWAGSYWGDYRYRHYHYHSHYYGYGCGARYLYGSGYYSDAIPALYGPYGGISGMAGYNPVTERYYRGGYARGPYGSAFARTSYNPYISDDVVQTGIRTPYTSWGESVVSKSSNWETAATLSGVAATAAGIRKSGGRAIVDGHKRRTGKGFKASTGKRDNLFVGKDGNIYKRDGKEWSKHTGKEGWKRSQARPDVKDRKAVKSRSRAAVLKDRKAGTGSLKAKKGKGAATQPLKQQRKRAKAAPPKAASTVRKQPKKPASRSKPTNRKQPQKSTSKKPRPTTRKQPQKGASRPKPTTRRQPQKSSSRSKPATRTQPQKSASKPKQAARKQPQKKCPKGKKECK